MEESQISNPMTHEDYLKLRVNEQIKWYDTRYRVYRMWFKYLRAVEMFLEALIPFVSSQLTVNGSLVKFFVGLMGSLVAVITGLVSLFKFQEHAIEYRTTAESLKHEKFLFLTHSSPYTEGGQAKRFSDFVNRIESLIAKEYSGWAQLESPGTKTNGG